MNYLLILDNNADEYANELRKRSLPDLKLVSLDSADYSNDIIQKINIILGEPGKIAKVLNHTDKLKWVQSSFAGVESLCKPGLKINYTLTGVKEVFGPLISEYVFAYILAFERNLFELKSNQSNFIWENLPYRSIAGIKIGICGLGSIGKHVAKTASYFKMNVTGLKRITGNVENVEQVYALSDLSKFVSKLDYLVITLPCTPATKHLINNHILSNMKKSAVIINVGRGSSIVEADLITALQNKMLRAAVLDVFEYEPLSVHSPLWKMENVIITPHNSARSFPVDIADIFEDNYLNFINNRPLKYVVDFTRGY
ncbi:MAG TPA: D-2-hydroxyacid dehydrogenase [Victivallales bacterium]|nr:D-2-hydroxyacid dehydrogenase [Victivallales bacterium]